MNPLLLSYHCNRLFPCLNIPPGAYNVSVAGHHYNGLLLCYSCHSPSSAAGSSQGHYGIGGLVCIVFIKGVKQVSFLRSGSDEFPFQKSRDRSSSSQLGLPVL